MHFNLPNALTWFRIIAIPLVVVVFYLPVTWARPAAGLLFALAGITDWLDGYLARRLGQTSSFGAFLDPVADKLIVATALVLLVQARAADVAAYKHFDLGFGRDPTVVLALVAAVIIGREITGVRAPRVDVADRRSRARRRELLRQMEDDVPDRRHRADALSRAVLGRRHLPHRRGDALRRGRAHALVDDRVSARGLARDARRGRPGQSALTLS